MAVIVTGGAGFIGSHVVEALLARGDTVHIVDDLSKGVRENVPAAATLHVHDVREPLDAIVRESGARAIVHLAAQADVRVSVTEPLRDAAINVLGTVNVLEAARDAGARVVFASTGGAFTRLYGTPHLALRFGNVYGPRQDPHGEAGVVAIFLGRLLDGDQCRIFGDGSQSRDYVYVGDVARATLAALDSDVDGVLNIGTGIATSVLELYDLCRRVAGSDATPHHEAARAGELGRSVLDVGRAGAAIGFRPEASLAEGVAATWESLQNGS
jgi:UDP-glucose 4-epimerase